MELLTLFEMLIARIEGEPDFQLAPSKIIQDNLQRTQDVISKVELIVDSKFQEYFQCSKNRYAHSIAIANSFLKESAKILDIGNAPGHLAMCLHNEGFGVTGVNLNAEWRKTYPDPKWMQLFSVLEVDIEKEDLPLF